MNNPKAFASTTDMDDRTVTFSEVGPDLYAYTAEGDPNSGIIIGDDGCIVVDTQATPAMANEVIARVRAVTNKPIKHVVMTHYHAVRTLGASAYGAEVIAASRATYDLLVERGEQDKMSEIGRFPRLFRGEHTIPPGLTWPNVVFDGAMSLFLGKREVKLLHLGSGHTRGDIVAYVPDAGVVFSGDLVEYHSACYCGDAYLRKWPATLDKIHQVNPTALVPGRGGALKGTAQVGDAIALTKAFITRLFDAAQLSVEKGFTLRETMSAVRDAMDRKFGSFAIYEHCMPFNVSRAYDEASGIDHPTIWTAERDRAMWDLLQA